MHAPTDDNNYMIGSHRPDPRAFKCACGCNLVDQNTSAAAIKSTYVTALNYV